MALFCNGASDCSSKKTVSNTHDNKLIKAVVGFQNNFGDFCGNFVWIFHGRNVIFGNLYSWAAPFGSLKTAFSFMPMVFLIYVLP